MQLTLLSDLATEVAVTNVHASQVDMLFGNAENASLVRCMLACLSKVIGHDACCVAVASAIAAAAPLHVSCLLRVCLIPSLLRAKAANNAAEKNPFLLKLFSNLLMTAVAEYCLYSSSPIL